MNTYTYVGGNPVMFVDPLGLQIANIYPEQIDKSTIDNMERFEQCMVNHPLIKVAIGTAAPLAGMKNSRQYRKSPGGYNPNKSRFTSIDKRFHRLPFANPNGGVTRQQELV